MFSIANLLERAKAGGNIESDYRLAKVLRINQTRLSNYRSGRSLPNVEMIEAMLRTAPQGLRLWGVTPLGFYPVAQAR